MEFLEKNIFTVVNKKKLKKGCLVYAARNMKDLRERVLGGEPPSILTRINDNEVAEKPYLVDSTTYPLIYFVDNPKPLEVSRMLSSWNAENVTEGDPVILGNSVLEIRNKLESNEYSEISYIANESVPNRFIDTNEQPFPLAYMLEKEITFNFKFSPSDNKTFLEGFSNYKITEEDLAAKMAHEDYKLVDFQIVPRFGFGYRIEGELEPL